MTAAKKKIGIIFDLDGVLVDTGPFHKQSWYDLARKEGFAMSDELFYGTFGMQNYKIIPMLAKRQLPAEVIQRLSEWKEQRYRQLIAEKLELPDGAKELLLNLKNNEYLLAIGSSAPRANLDFVLLGCAGLRPSEQRVHISNYFDAYITSEDVSNSKPAPDTFLKAAEKLSLPPRCCIVIEDSIQGIEAGKAAGMTVVAITTTRKRQDLKQADLIVDSLTELKAEDFLNLQKKEIKN